MPAWTSKDERQYEHIKDSALERGESEPEAQEIAARTVNKHRRQAGRTPNKTTQGTGNPHRRLQDRTKDELYRLAQEKGITGRSQMSKSDLVKALQ